MTNAEQSTFTSSVAVDAPRPGAAASHAAITRAADGDPLLQLQDICVTFGSTQVVKQVSLDVHPGEVVALIGPSGAGKSTLLRSINHLEPHSGGTITLDGKPIGKGRSSLDSLRREVGMVFQQFNLFPHLSAVENVMLAQTHTLKRPRREARERALKELAYVGLAEHAEKKPAKCSGGQQQRIAIARALAMDPKVMLFDEPTSSLDPELGVEVLNTMRRLAQEGMTMIVVTHEMQFAEDVADRVVFMCNGEILEEGPPEQVMRKPKHARVSQFLRAVRDR